MQELHSFAVRLVRLAQAFALKETFVDAMQALGQFHTDAFISLGSRISMLLLMIELMRQMGLQGLALSRLCYGPVALLVYLPLLWKFDIGTRERNDASALARVSQVQEGAKP